MTVISCNSALPGQIRCPPLRCAAECPHGTLCWVHFSPQRSFGVCQVWQSHSDLWALQVLVNAPTILQPHHCGFLLHSAV